MGKALTAAAALGLGVLLLTGCGGSGTDDEAKNASRATPAQTAGESPEPAQDKGLDGTWRPVNDSPIETLKITGRKVATTGELACPGTLNDAGAKQPRITLDCEKPDPDREKGDLETKTDGSAIVINWDGPEWGGLIDSLRRA